MCDISGWFESTVPALFPLNLVFTLTLVSVGWGKKKALKQCPKISVSISTVLVISSEHSTAGSAVKEGNSILDRLSAMLNKRSCTWLWRSKVKELIFRIILKSMTYTSVSSLFMGSRDLLLAAIRVLDWMSLQSDSAHYGWLLLLWSIFDNIL